MKNVLLRGLPLCLVFFITPGAFGYDGDWQLWNTESIEGELTENWKVNLEEEFRWGDDIGQLYYHHADAGIVYKMIDCFQVGLNYRHIYEKREGEWNEENRPHINGTIQWKWASFACQDRSRIECRVLRGDKNTWRYRNKLTVSLPVKWTESEIQPYWADEVFVDFDSGELNCNRLYIGLTWVIINHLTGNIFHLWQASKGTTGWIDYNVVGIKVGAQF